MFQQNSHIFPFFLKECVPYGCRNRPTQHPSHSSIVSWLTMTQFSVSILLLLFCLKICTAMKIHRNPMVGRLIQTKSGNLFLQHSNKAKKGNQFIQESLQAAGSSIDGHDGVSCANGRRAQSCAACPMVILKIFLCFRFLNMKVSTRRRVRVKVYVDDRLWEEYVQDRQIIIRIRSLKSNTGLRNGLAPLKVCLMRRFLICWIGVTSS